jgi:triosephosphate isomerase
MDKWKFWIGTGWKMNMLRADAQGFATTLKAAPASRSNRVQLFVLPPFPYISDVAGILSGTRVIVGAQNMHWQDKGAWTGEISPPMLRDCGASLVELGHSERRVHFGETDEMVSLKVKAALAHGLIALVCIGDTRKEHEAGATADVLARQTHHALRHVGPQDVDNVILAYEPVWSIGDGATAANPEFVAEQHGKLKRLTAQLLGTSLRILYGGSVNLQNCVSLATRSGIDGLFIGRSAWTADGYVSIVNAVDAALNAKA